MWDRQTSIDFINSKAEKESKGKCAAYVRRAIEAGGVKIHIPAPRFGASASACDYGPSLVSAGFKTVLSFSGTGNTDTVRINGQQPGDVVVIQPIAGHPHGHIAFYNGVNWVSDFIQYNGFYPGKKYREVKPSFILYRFDAQDKTEKIEQQDKRKLIKIEFPIPKENGHEFTNLEEILAHLEGEHTGNYLIGSNGMWHGGIHITDTTTPWCALKGKADSENIDFPIPYKGKQFVRCMGDGEIVAYRICKDYMRTQWEGLTLNFSGSFLLVKHYLQPGVTEKSGLNFYTLYMHLAPFDAYVVKSNNKKWKSQDRLSLYKPEWVMSAGTNNKEYSQSFRVATLPKGSIVEWDSADPNLHTTNYKNRGYGLVKIKKVSDDLGNKLKQEILENEYWMLVDKGNIKEHESETLTPSWWKYFRPPFKNEIKYNEVITLDTPLPISAGSSIGHLGYFQVAKDGGYNSRYQVHIECLSSDDNMLSFLTNPENVGKKKPYYLMCTKTTEFYRKDIASSSIIKDTKTINDNKIFPLNKLAKEKDKITKRDFWFLKSDNAYVPTDAKNVEQLSKYDLGKIGFKTLVENPSTFNHLDGKNQPNGLVHKIIELLYDSSKNDGRISHTLAQHNYKRILNKIDSHSIGYSTSEYYHAIHNYEYHDVVHNLVVKHPSDWFYKEGNLLWNDYLKQLKKESSSWAKYSESFLSKISWIQDLKIHDLNNGSDTNPSLWHMHPITFLGRLQDDRKLIWIKMVEHLFGAVVAQSFKNKVIEVGKELLIDPNFIMACMALETGEKFNTSTKNPKSSATGLIQFMSVTARNLGTTTSQLSTMTHVEQMDYVKKYFISQAKNFNYPTRKWSLGDVYLSIFTPSAMLLKDSDIVYATGQNAYHDNLFHDRNKDGKITKKEIIKNIDVFYEKGFLYEG